MSLTLFIDHLSQPSRTLLAFCLLNNIPHTLQDTRIMKGLNRTPEYLKISPEGKVPAIKHGDFTLTESHAILAYLCAVFPVEEHWYPKDPKARARVDSYLHWHHLNTRQGLAGYIFNKYLLPTITKRTLDPAVEKMLLAVQKRALKLIDNVLSKSRYIVTSDKPTIADLTCYTEFTQYKLIKTNFNEYAHITRWVNDMAAIPALQKSHEVFNQLATRIKL